MTPEPEDQELFGLLLGELSAARAEELEVWSKSTIERQRRVAELRALLSRLEEHPPSNLLSGLDAKLDAARPPRRPRRWPAGVAVALAAGLALMWVGAGSEAEEVRRKGSARLDKDKWAGIEIYRLALQGKPVPLGREFSQSDSLLFAYRNGGPDPFTHLMVFGVASSGQVFWYYPAWLHEDEDPGALPIQASKEVVELHEQIRQPIPPGRFVLHAVFARERLQVSTVERVIGQTDGGLNEALPDTVQQQFLLEVSE